MSIEKRFNGEQALAEFEARWEVLTVLREVEEFLDDQSDVVDGSYGVPAPNRAMTLLTEVREAIRKAEGSAPVTTPNRAGTTGE